LLGIQREMEGARRNAEAIASVEQFNRYRPDRLVEAMAGLRQNELQVSTSAKVLSAVDGMIGALIDEKA
jgi:hypothetical protein